MKRNIVIAVAALIAIAALCTIIWATSTGFRGSAGGTQPSSAVSTTGGTQPSETTLPTQSHPTQPTACQHLYAVSELQEATCLDGGHRVYTCQYCSDSYTETLEALNHSFTSFVSNGDATCEQDGTKTAQCDRCEETQTIADEGSAVGHRYEDQVVAPTCTQQGYTIHTCACGATLQDSYVAAPGHSFVVNTVPATCTQDGFTRYTCTACTLTTKENKVSAFGHAYGAWTVLSPMTCDQDLVEQRTCANCAGVETQTTPAPGHTFGEWTACEEAIGEYVTAEERTCTACEEKQISLNLSNASADQAADLAEKIALLSNVSAVELMKSDGTTNFTVADVKSLVEAAPNAVFNYSFDFFGLTINTSDEKVELANVAIGDAGEPQIRAALDILNQCTYFKLDDCGIDYEIMASIRDDYPETKVVWRIHVGHKSWLTDTDTLRALYLIDNSNSGPLKYLTDVKYMDLGHNESMVDLSFIAYMPDLEIAILSGSPIKDLTPLANCKKLVFLELAWCGHLKDISPLAACDSLIYLNVGHTQVSDFSALYGMDLQMLSYVNSGNRVGFTAADWAMLQTQFPNCWITYDPLYDINASPYGVGWRYKENWNGYTPIYRKVRDVFNYDYIDSILQGGAT